jgi:hypothetical protein
LSVVKSIAALLAAIFILISSTHAALVFGNLGSAGTGALGTSSFQITSTQYLAQGFKTAGPGGLLSLDSIVLGLNVNTGSTDTRVQIFADSSGLPSGSPLATIIGSVNSTVPALYTFTPASPLLLASDSTYWIVVSDPDAGQQYNWVYNDDEVSPTGYNASGYIWPAAGTLRSVNSGTSWIDRSSSIERTASFYLNASAPAAVPEPGTWAAAALLVGGAAYARWRKRKVA